MLVHTINCGTKIWFYNNVLCSAWDAGPVSDDMDAPWHISGLDRQFKFKSPNQRQETASDQRDSDRNARMKTEILLAL